MSNRARGANRKNNRRQKKYLKEFVVMLPTLREERNGKKTWRNPLKVLRRNKHNEHMQKKVTENN